MVEDVASTKLETREEIIAFCEGYVKGETMRGFEAASQMFGMANESYEDASKWSNEVHASIMRRYDKANSTLNATYTVCAMVVLITMFFVIVSTGAVNGWW